MCLSCGLAAGDWLMWYVYQIAVVFGVMAHSIYFEWIKDSGGAPFILGVGLAYVTTVWGQNLLNRIRSRKRRAITGLQEPSQELRPLGFNAPGSLRDGRNSILINQKPGKGT